MDQLLSSYSGLMLALDIEEFDMVDRVLCNNAKYIDVVKVGTTILTSPKAGNRVIAYIKKKYSLPIVVDSKLKDVPHVLLSTARSYAQHGASAITCWADVGEESLRLLLKNLDGVIEVVVMTALTSLPLSIQENCAKNNIQMAINCGCRFIQIPGNFPELIKWARKNIPHDTKIVSCGIGAQGGTVGEAIKCGANFEIIGRKLLDCQNDFEMNDRFKEIHGLIHESLNISVYH